MWNAKKSILLSRICVIVFMVLLAAVAVLAPLIILRVFGYTGMAGYFTYFLVTVYVGCVPAALLLIFLFILLRRIDSGEVFIQKNVDSLRYISWCCFAGAAVSAVSLFYYFPWVMVAVAAAFMGLIVRIVKNIFGRAVALQDDADHTI